MSDLGDRIKSLLTQKQISQKELASRAECTEAAISLYIRGERIPRAKMLAKIAAALDTTTEYLLDGTPQNVTEEIDYATKLIARNAEQMSNEEKKRIINILFGGDNE